MVFGCLFGMKLLDLLEQYKSQQLSVIYSKDLQVWSEQTNKHIFNNLCLRGLHLLTKRAPGEINDFR